MAKITVDQALLASHDPASMNPLFINRVMDVVEQPKMNTLFASLQRMPKFALALAVIATLLAVSGTTYAAYQLWFKPNATVQQFGQNQEGRNEALVTFKNCQNQASTRYEVKSNASLTAPQVEQLLRARCEMDAINKWALSASPTTTEAPPMAYPGAFTVTKIDGTKVSLHNPTYDTTVTVTEKSIAIINGVPVAASSIKVGDLVTYVEHYTYNPGGGHPTSRTLLAIVTLQLPAEFYDTTMQNMVATRKACYGNPTESCIESGLIDVYPRNGENNMATVEPGDNFEVQGRIVKHDGNTVSLRASSGAVYTFTAPHDVIAKFNTENSAGYENTKIGVGDMLMILYTKKQGEDPKAIQPNQLRSVSLLIELISKQDPLKKY